MHFVEDSSTVKNSFAFNSFPLSSFLKKDSTGEGRERGDCVGVLQGGRWAGADCSVPAAVPSAVGFLQPYPLVFYRVPGTRPCSREPPAWKSCSCYQVGCDFVGVFLGFAACF